MRLAEGGFGASRAFWIPDLRREEFKLAIGNVLARSFDEGRSASDR